MNRKRVIIATALIALLLAAISIALILTLDARDAEEPQPSTPAPTDAVFEESTSAAQTRGPEPTAEPTPEPVVENQIVSNNGMVLSGEKLSFGLATNGLLSYIGSNEGQAYCYDWENVVKLVGGKAYTAGLTADGGMLLSGPESMIDKVSEWQGVVDIAASEDVLYALTEDGRVLSTDGSTDELRGVTMFTAGDDFLICFCRDNALAAGGSFIGVGNAPDITALEGLVPAAMASGRGFVCGLAEDGGFFTTKTDDPFSCIGEIAEIASVFAGGEYTGIITADGIFYTDCGLFPESISQEGLFALKNTSYVSFGVGHALALRTDGSVTAYGDNTCLQCETDTWQLTPYMTEDGYILGLSVGEPDESGSVIKTGDYYALPDGASGIAVILGDIDMDGDIDSEDLDILNQYIKGRKTLSALQLRAANVFCDSSDPDSVDNADLVRLSYHISGYSEIDQYAKAFAYSKEVAKYQNINTDAAGYISIENTNIAGPLMYGDDFYYHSHNYAKTPTSRGSLYLYYGRPTKNIVISGHNLRVAGIMLHQLHTIQDKYAKDYDVFANRVWTINVFGETHLWEVFAMYEEKPSRASDSSQYYNCNYAYMMDSMTEEEIADWIIYQQERTELDYQLHVTPDDSFITILTCADQHWESNLGGRIYFFLRRIDGH